MSGKAEVSNSFSIGVDGDRFVGVEVSEDGCLSTKSVMSSKDNSVGECKGVSSSVEVVPLHRTVLHVALILKYLALHMTFHT